jgi:type II secretory ATPase GspE/PulE/Tfp pilus assembly ATPase PilB-like protein
MSVVTLEDQTAVEIEGVDHELIPPDADGEMLANMVAAVIRRDPRVFMLSRLSDPKVAYVLSAETAQESRFYVGVPAEDTMTALRKWVKAVGDADRAGHALEAVLCQRLVRRLCPTCRVVYKPDPAALKKMNLPPERISQLYKASGHVLVRDKPQVCPHCHGLGYRGRVGVFEVMVLDDRARSLIAEGQLEQLRAHLRKNKMLWLQEAGLSRAVEGVTSVSEVTRAMGEGASGRSTAGRSAAGRSSLGAQSGGRSSTGPGKSGR